MSGWRSTQKYSWLKSPRYDGAAMEVGPLARMLVAYSTGRPARVKELVDKTLSSLGVGPTALFSTLGRIAARAIEAQVLGRVDGHVGRRARRKHGRAATTASRTTRNGIPAVGRAIASAPVSMRRRAARSAIGCISATARSPITNAWCRAPGMPVRAMPRAIPALMKPRWSALPSPSPISRSKSCARCIPSIRAWPAASMWLMR